MDRTDADTAQVYIGAELRHVTAKKCPQIYCLAALAVVIFKEACLTFTDDQGREVIGGCLRMTLAWPLIRDTILSQS